VIAFYDEAIPVVVDTVDIEVVKNVLNELPMHYAFKGKETDVFAGLKKCAEIVQPWQPKSTIVLVVSDGDTVPATGMPKMPPSVANVLVVGVGDPVAGKFIAGRHSRQDVSMLRQVAARLGGEFHNGNAKQISTDMIQRLTQDTTQRKWKELTRREYALVAIAIGGTVLALLPVLLHYFGTAYYAGVPTVRRTKSSAVHYVQRETV
jgi:Ca-activated chloride channel family protein